MHTFDWFNRLACKRVTIFCTALERLNTSQWFVFGSYEVRWCLPRSFICFLTNKCMKLMKVRYLTSDNCISGKQRAFQTGKVMWIAYWEWLNCNQFQIKNALFCCFIWLLKYLWVNMYSLACSCQLIEIVHRHIGSSINVWCAERYQFKNITASCKSQS